MEILDDLIDEQDALGQIMEPLDDDAWRLDTPSPGWTVAHQIAHLAYFDRAGAQAIADPEGFSAQRDALVERAMQGESLDDLTITGVVTASPAEILADWSDARQTLATAAGGAVDGDRFEWFGPSMSARSFLTARLMEVWAHGQDIIDALDDAGVAHATREPTDRLRHIAHLGYVTRGWSYAVRGVDAPAGEVRVVLDAPDASTWTWGPEDAAASIAGPAVEFCAVVTQRRHVADTTLSVTGDEATDWMNNAQAFAGGATTGPPPGSRPPLH
ncbi:MAG: TIGR03084 family metal-binding protein [Microthrixaceae bacterium]